MSRPINILILLASVPLLAAIVFSVPASAEDAPARVLEGIVHFKRGELDAAEKAFAEAGLARPEDARIAFDQACVFAAKGDTDRAIERFQRAALSREEDLALKARFNLGSLSATRAQNLFGEDPAAADGETRQEGVDLLLRAVGHFRDCLRIDPDHEKARYNIELIRTWIKHYQALWKERDRQKARDEMNLLKFVLWLLERQEALRDGIRAFADLEDTPMRRQALVESKTAQDELAEEIEPLKAKIDEALSASQPGAGGAGPGAAPSGAADPARTEQARTVLQGWADDAREAMEEASGFVMDSPSEALSPQNRGMESLDRIFGAAGSFEAVLMAAIRDEQAVVNHTVPLVERGDTSSNANAESDETKEALEAEEAANRDDPETDEPSIDRTWSATYPGIAWRQGRVPSWADMMGHKAAQQLNTIESGSDPSSPGMDKLGTKPPGVKREGVKPQGADPEAGKKREDALRKALNLAIETAPIIRELADQAHQDLEAEKGPDALPKAEEALALLKKIHEALPKEDQGDQGDQKKDQDQDQDQDQNKNQDQQNERQRKAPGEMSREQAEGLLKKAKEREREHRDQQERLQGLMRKPSKVEKDW